MVVGTHGRSIYKANIAPLQLMTKELMSKEHHIFTISNIKKRANWGNARSKCSKPFKPKVTIPLYALKSGKITIEIYSNKKLVNTIKTNLDKGYNEVDFDLTLSKSGIKNYTASKKKIIAAKNGKHYLPKGDYTVKLKNQEEKFPIYSMVLNLFLFIC